MKAHRHPVLPILVMMPPLIEQPLALASEPIVGLV